MGETSLYAGHVSKSRRCYGRQGKADMTEGIMRKAISVSRVTLGSGSSGYARYDANAWAVV